MSFKLVTTKEGGTAVEAVLEKGFQGTINGLEVIFEENLHFTIKNAANLEQAVEFCTIQGVPVDFSHFDHDKGVQVSYNSHGTRIETVPAVEEVVEVKETKAQEKARLKAEKEAADKEAEEAAADAEAAAKKAEEEAAKANTETEETEGK